MSYGFIDVVLIHVKWLQSFFPINCIILELMVAIDERTKVRKMARVCSIHRYPQLSKILEMIQASNRVKKEGQENDKGFSIHRCTQLSKYFDYDTRQL